MYVDYFCPYFFGMEKLFKRYFYRSTGDVV